MINYAILSGVSDLADVLCLSVEDVEVPACSIASKKWEVKFKLFSFALKPLLTSAVEVLKDWSSVINNYKESMNIELVFIYISEVW